MPDTRKYTEAQKKSAKKWDAVNLDRLSIALPKGSRDTIKAHAAVHGESVNSFIGRAISETMERDGADRPQEAVGGPQGAGVVSLPSQTLEVAQEAAQAAGETVPQFIERAVEMQAKRDKGD